MPQWMIKLLSENPHSQCALCDRPLPAEAGLYLCREADPEEVICRECGRQQAPSLAALLDLAGVAQRVGQIGRHTLVPPLHALLDLVRAAENYCDQQPCRRRRAA
jgi:hypothetical protein